METLQNPAYFSTGANSSSRSCSRSPDTWTPNYPAPEYVCGYELSPSPGGHLSLPVLSSLNVPDVLMAKQSWFPCNGDDLTQLSQGCIRRDSGYYTQYHHPYHPGYHPDHHATHPTTIARRNERERNRVKTINSTFSKLRQHLPCSSKNKKLSKVQILRSAIQYIGQLQHVLSAQEEEQQPGKRCKVEARSEEESSMDCPRVFDAVSGAINENSTSSASASVSSKSPVSSTAASSPSSLLTFDDEEDETDFIGEFSNWMHQW